MFFGMSFDTNRLFTSENLRVFGLVHEAYESEPILYEKVCPPNWFQEEYRDCLKLQIGMLLSVFVGCFLMIRISLSI